MKKIILILSVTLLCFSGAFAYSPSTSLVEKMDVVVSQFEDVIDTKGESYRVNVLLTLELYAVDYSDDERISYILSYLYDNLI